MEETYRSMQKSPKRKGNKYFSIFANFRLLPLLPDKLRAQIDFLCRKWKIIISRFWRRFFSFYWKLLNALHSKWQGKPTKRGKNFHSTVFSNWSETAGKGFVVEVTWRLSKFCEQKQLLSFISRELDKGALSLPTKWPYRSCSMSMFHWIKFCKKSSIKGKTSSWIKALSAVFGLALMDSL